MRYEKAALCWIVLFLIAMVVVVHNADRIDGTHNQTQTFKKRFDNGGGCLYCRSRNTTQKEDRMGMAVIGTSVPEQLRDRFAAMCEARRSDMSKMLKGMIKDELAAFDANPELDKVTAEKEATR